MESLLTLMGDQTRNFQQPQLSCTQNLATPECTVIINFWGFYEEFGLW